MSLLSVLTVMVGPTVAARETVDASAPTALAVTLYRDPDRGPGDAGPGHALAG